MICKIYGFIDLITASILLFGFTAIPSLIKWVIIIVMLIKGVPSLAADIIGKLYGVVDLIAALLIYSSELPIPDFIRFMVIAILIFKGILSLLG